MQSSNCVAIVNQFKVFWWSGGQPRNGRGSGEWAENGDRIRGYPSIVVHLRGLLGAATPTF